MKPFNPNPEGSASEPAGLPSCDNEEIVLLTYFCYLCGKTRVDSDEHENWFIVWRHEHSVVTSIRPWDKVVAVIEGRPSFCSLEHAIEYAKTLALGAAKDGVKL